MGKYSLDIFGVETIPGCILKIPQEVFNDFKIGGKEYDSHYDKIEFDEAFFFGSLMRDTTVELERFNFNLKNKFDYKKYEEPLKEIFKPGSIKSHIRFLKMEKETARQSVRKFGKNLLLILIPLSKKVIEVELRIPIYGDAVSKNNYWRQRPLEQ